MNKARTEKVAVVDEVKNRVETTSTAVVTEYRGLTVAEISTLRRELRAADADYKVSKNTLVRRAVSGTPSESLTEFLEGPTAIAWIKGDISAVAKVLKEFAKATPSLVLKGGVLDGTSLSAADLNALADLPSRDVMLAQLAGLLGSPMSKLAGLLKAIPQNFAYGLSALLESKGGAVAAPVEAVPASEPVVDDAPVDSVDEPSDEAVVDDVSSENASDDASADTSGDAASDESTDAVTTD
jgi:large subunit ribosomal protein L10